MRLLFRLPKLLGALAIAGVCAVPITYAVELEGTVVTTDDSPQVQSSTSASTGVILDPSERSQWQQEQQDYAREQEDFAREQEGYAREQAGHASEQAAHAHKQAEQAAAQAGDHQNWEHNWEKNLNEVFEGKHNGDSDFNPALLIPLFAILFIFGGPIILMILLLVFFFGSKRRRQRDINNNIDKLLAAGRDIPVELLRGDEPKTADDTGNQAKGIRNICLGSGWLVFLTIAFDIEIGAVGFIWIALGLSQVLIWYLNKPKVTEQAGQQD